MLISLVLGLLLGAASIVFALQNITTITVSFFSWQFEGSLALILLLAVGVGSLITWLVLLPDIITRSFQLSALKREGNRLQEEVIHKKIEVETEKSKLAANNAYLDSIKTTPRKI